MKKFLKLILCMLFLGLVIFFADQNSVKATTQLSVETVEQLKEQIDNSATISGNVITLSKDSVIQDKNIIVKINDVVIDFNGKMLKLNGDTNFWISDKSKVTFKDSLATGGITIDGETLNGIDIFKGSEVIIENGNYINNTAKYTIYSSGKLTINNAKFITNRNDDKNRSEGSAIFMRESTETVINNSEFNLGYGAIYITPNGSNKNRNDAKLTVNNSKFNLTGGWSAIRVMANYPYVNENNEKEIIVPKIAFNNCNINHSSNSSFDFRGGCTDKEFKTANTRIITISGGTYQKNLSIGPDKYFNPNDVIIENATFQSEKFYMRGAISIEEIEGKEYQYQSGEIEKYLKGYKGKLYESDIYATTMTTVVIENGTVVSTSGGLNSLSWENVIDKGSFEGTDTSAPIDVRDVATDIRISTNDEIVPLGTVFKIEEIKNGNSYNKVKTILKEGTKFKVYDIKLKLDESYIQPKGKIKMSIPIPTNFDKSKLIVYRIEEDGTKVEYKVKIEDEYATFETDHFSTYVLAEENSNITDTENNLGVNNNETPSKNKLPQTGEETNTFAEWLTITILLMIFWLGSMIWINYEKKKIAKK